MVVRPCLEKATLESEGSPSTLESREPREFCGPTLQGATQCMLTLSGLSNVVLFVYK